MEPSPLMSRRAALAGAAALLAAALPGCAAPPVPDLPELVVATGPKGAVFREIGAALVALLRERLPETRVRPVSTAASRENIRLLREGSAGVAFTSLDSAVSGSGAAPPGTSALGRIYDSHLHLVVRADSAVESFDDLADLDGDRVSFGARGSGTEFTVERLCALTGLDVADVRLDQASSAAALRSGEIEAFFSVTGIPTPAITGLARDSAVRLIPLRAQAERLADAHPGPYVPAGIPATAYRGLPACPTVAIPNLLAARSDLPRDVAAAVTETVFTHASRLAADRPEAAHVNVRTGIATGPLPLHPGARDWFRDQKV